MESSGALGVYTNMPRPFRLVYPSATLPLEKTRKTRGALVSVVVHVLVLVLILWEQVPESNPQGTGAGPGERGGGGGGGASSVTYIQMPAYQVQRSELTFQVQRQEPQVEVPEVQPQVVVSPTVVRPTRMADRQIAARPIGSGDGSVGGPGRGPGSGGGVGSGEGTGRGSDRGPGTGGGAGNIFPPSPRNISLPPQPVPDELKGMSYQIRFWVDSTGVVTNVTVSPRVEHSGYREKWMRQLRDFIFNPATRPDGTPIPGEFPMVVRLS